MKTRLLRMIATEERRQRRDERADLRRQQREQRARAEAADPSPNESGPLPILTCPLCDQAFPLSGVACTAEWLQLPIHSRPQVSHHRVPWTGRRPCPECATPPGSPHHLPCEREYCPACGDGQRISSCLRHFLWTALPSPRDL